MMKSHIINDQAEFVKAYHYDEKYALNSLPDVYPCILLLTNNEGGIGGSSVEHEVIYFPKNVNNNDYFAGFNLALSKFSK